MGGWGGGRSGTHVATASGRYAAGKGWRAADCCRPDGCRDRPRHEVFVLEKALPQAPLLHGRNRGGPRLPKEHRTVPAVGRRVSRVPPAHVVHGQQVVQNCWVLPLGGSGEEHRRVRRRAYHRVGRSAGVTPKPSAMPSEVSPGRMSRGAFRPPPQPPARRLPYGTRQRRWRKGACRGWCGGGRC